MTVIIGISDRPISLRLSPLIDVTTSHFLEAWQINSTHTPLNGDNGGLLLDAYLQLVRKKTS